jgi:hypothetical protein
MLRRTTVAGTFFAWAISLAFGADLSSTATKMTAQQVVEKNVAARGGLQSWRSVLELDFRGLTPIQVYDGVNGWKLHTFLTRHEVERYTPVEIKAAAPQSDLDGPLVDYLAKGTKLELAGPEKVEGKENYCLKLTMKNHHTLRVWVDAGTFLDTEMEGTPRLDGKYQPVEIFLGDDGEVSRLVVPYLLETKVQGVAQTEKIEVKNITVNPKLEDSRFAQPQ